MSDTAEWFTDSVREQIADCVRRAYPQEGCGLVLRDSDGEYYAKCCQNLADKYHRADPETYPAGADKFYVIDGREFMAAEERGEKIEIVFHSHVDRGDYFSERDRDAALRYDDSAEQYRPVYPGVGYLVVSVMDGEAVEGTVYRFESDSEGFEASLQVGW